MKILILGSEGFIGKHAVAYLTKAGHLVFGADLFEQPSQHYTYFKISRLSPELDDLFLAKTYDAVINAAGSANVPYSMAHPLLDFEANSLDTIRLLDTIRKNQPACKYIHLSSAAVYGNPVRLPIGETDILHPLSPYGWHKLVSEQLCREYTQVYQLRTAILRPFSVYGAGLKKQLFWDLYQKTKHADTIELFGTGNESRDYIHVNDVVRALDHIIQFAPMESEAYNLASGIETSIADVVSIYFNKLGYNLPYRFNGAIRPGDPLNWRADISMITRLGFSVETKLEDGLQGVADWMKTT